MYELFLITPTLEVLVSLRRYRSAYGTATPNAVSVVGREERPLDDDPEFVTAHPSYPDDDPRWPAAAADGYVFQPEDGRVVDFERLYRTPGGELVTRRTAAVGAVLLEDLDAWFERFLSRQYLEQHKGKRDVLFVKVPNGLDGAWISPDYAWRRGDAGNPQRDGWTVTGEVPRISVTPSINLVGTYHGWIGVQGCPPGFMSRDLDGRPY